jgi:hypothetical protein
MEELDVKYVEKIVEDLLVSGELSKLTITDDEDLKIKNSVEESIEDIKDNLKEIEDDLDDELKKELSEIYSSFTNEMNDFFTEFVDKDKKNEAKVRLYSILITNFFDKIRDEENSNPCSIL